MKKKFFHILAIVLLLFTSNSLFGQYCPEEIAESFFQLYQKEDISQAIELMHDKKQWAALSPQQLEIVQSQLIHISKGFVGRLMSRNLLSRTESTQYQLNLVYTLVFEQQLFQLNLAFQNLAEKWKIKYIKAIPLGINLGKPVKTNKRGCTNGGTIFGG